MHKIPIFKYFAFGYDYGLISRNGLLAREKGSAVELVTSFFSSLRELDLAVTLKVAEPLRVIAAEFEEGNSPTVSPDLAKKVLTELEKIDPCLDAELELRTAYVLTKKRYALGSLLDEPQTLLGTGVEDSLSDTCKKDFRLACTQIALSQPTAAAFHLMRALEEQVKCLYFAFKKTNRLDKPMWGPMTAELKAKKKPKPSEKLLSHLDGMRIHFRNPTQHPNVFYTIDEAQDLLNQTLTAINMIAAELPKKG